MKQSDSLSPDTGVETEISQAWKLVELRVIQMAGGDASKIQAGLDIDAVLAQLGQAQAKDKKSVEKYATIQTIFRRTLQCIETVGGIVTTHVSAVFAPANTCYNALTFVISAWKGYEGIFDSLASLLEKCTEFLDRLSYYTQAGMDAKLTRVACRHLQLFVDICDRSLQLRQKRHKLAAFMKQLFLNDDGVQGLLGAMESLIDKERGLVAAQTWKSSNEAAENSRDGLVLTRKVHNSLLEDKTQMKREKEVSAWKQSIIKTLDCDRSILDSNIPPPWELAWKKYRTEIAAGSGEWLMEDARFRSWVKGTSPILGLQGGEGTGKTFLASNVILQLKKEKTGPIKELSSRAIVAHDFMEVPGYSDALSISKYVMCQLALDDEPFMKSVAGICDRSKFFGSALETWTRIFFENEDLEEMDATLFVVLDSIEDKIDEFINIFQEFTNRDFGKRVRILLTGTSETFQKIHQAGGINVEKIVLKHNNRRDVEAYVKLRMNQMDILKETTRPGVNQIRREISDSLVESTEGDYYQVNRVLDNIAKTDDVEEIRSHLESAGSTLSEQIEAEIESINRTRTHKEIKELNELIKWVDGASLLLSPEALEGALELGLGGSGSSSLMSLRSKIETKYTIFKLTGNLIEFKNYEIRKMIPNKDSSISSELQILDSQQITPGEVKIIRHYLSTVCPEELYQKFKFEEFFESKLVREGVYIHQDLDNVQVMLALRCLRCLVEPRNEKTEMMLEYSQHALLKHLVAADRSLTDRQLLEELGVMLVRLFSERYATDSLLGLNGGGEKSSRVKFGSYNYQRPTAWIDWILRDDAVNQLAEWFNDSAVIKRVKDHPLIVSFKQDGADRVSVLFGEAMKRAAKDIFQRDTLKYDTLMAYLLISSIFCKKTDQSPFQVWEPKVDMFRLVEDYARTVVEGPVDEIIWDAYAADLLIYLDGDGMSAMALERAKKAVASDSKNWRASYAVSKVIESNEEAIKLLQSVISTLEADKKWLSEENHRVILATVMFDLGNQYWQAERIDEAVKTYSSILEIDQSEGVLNGFSPVFEDYDKMHLWDAMMQLIEQLIGFAKHEKGTISNFFYQKLDETGFIFENFQGIIARTAQAMDRIDIVDGIINTAIAGDPNPKKLFDIRSYHASILLEMEGKEKAAMDVWDENFKIANDKQRLQAIGICLPVWLKISLNESTTAGDKELYHKKIEGCFEEFEHHIIRHDSLLVGVARHFAMRKDTLHLKRLTRIRVREALEMLSDDDLSNDDLSLWTLNMVFALMRDMPNLHVNGMLLRLAHKAKKLDRKRRIEIWKQKEANRPKYEWEEEAEEVKSEGVGDGQEESTPPSKDGGGGEPDEVTGQEMGGDQKSDDSDGEEDTDGKMWWYMGTEPKEDDVNDDPWYLPVHALRCEGCDGLCNSFDGIWMCLTEGGRMQYDEECYRKLQTGELSVPGCDGDHEFTKLLVFDKADMDALPEACVRVEDEVVTFQEWKERIRTMYVDFE